MTFMEIKRTRNHFTFVWALTNVIEMGTIDSKKITDDEIKEAYQNEIERQKKLDGTCWYTPEVVRDVLITQRELANCEFEELMNGIVKEDLWNAHKISWDRMSEIAGAAIQNLDSVSKEDFISDCDLDEDEAEWFGGDE